MNRPSLDRLLGEAFESADVDVRRRARVLAAFLLIMIGASVVLLPVAVALGLWGNAIGIFLLFAVASGLLVLLRRGTSLERLGTVTALVLFGVATQGALAMGGLGAPPLSWYGVLPLLVLLVAGPRLGKFFAGLGVLGHTVFFIAERHGFGPANVEPTARYVDALVITAFVFALALVYERFKQRALGEMRLAQDRIEVLQGQLVSAAHAAGMAEVSASVLHNAGNALNHVTTGAVLAAERLGELRLDGLARLSSKLTREAVSDDEAVLAAYVAELFRTLSAQRDAVGSELASIKESLAHVVAVVESQHQYADGSEHHALLDLRQTLEDVIRLERAACKDRAVVIVTDLDHVPPFLANKHPVLLVFVNLFRNAVRAVEDVKDGKAGGRISVRLRAGEDSVSIAVEDTGIGIAEENLTKVFHQGFTTKSSGHGLGLHSSALAATKLGGRLFCESKGPNLGATFVLEIPMRRAA